MRPLPRCISRQRLPRKRIGGRSWRFTTHGRWVARIGAGINQESAQVAGVTSDGSIVETVHDTKTVAFVKTCLKIRRLNHVSGSRFPRKFVFSLPEIIRHSGYFKEPRTLASNKLLFNSSERVDPLSKYSIGTLGLNLA